MTEEQAQKLLANARQASELSRDAQAAMLEAGEKRRDAVRACMDAGIPRQQIADAIGSHISVIYRLTR